MPWTAKSFSERHNGSLRGEKAAHAARIANAVLRSGQPDGLAIAIANRWAQRHRRAAGGGVDTSATDAQMAAYNAIAQAHAGAGAYAHGMFGGGGQSPQMAPLAPPLAPPSYLAGTAGSPVDTSALPQYRPQVPQSMGINSAGLMNVPQTGDFYLDPTTGAMSGASQAALKALAQRGLQIGAPAAAAGAPGAGGAGPAPIIGQGGSGPEGAGNSEAAGNAGNAGGANVQGGGGGRGGSGGGLSINFGNIPGDIIQGIGGIAGGAIGSAAMPGVGTAVGGYGGSKAGAALANAMGLATGSIFDWGGGEGTAGSGPSGDAPEIGGGNTNGLIARGGRIGRAAGGALSPSQQAPWYTRAEARAGEHPSGLVMSPVAGRSDHIPLSLAAGSYVAPADVTSGIGQGNSLAGAHAFDEMIRNGPYGTKLPMPRLRGTLPKPPGMPKTFNPQHFADGGAVNEDDVPVIVAGGERIFSPDEVAALSGGDVKKGHEMLDRFMVEARKHAVKHTKDLPPPVK